MNPFKGSRALLLSVLVPLMLPSVLPDALRWTWLTLAILFVLKALGIVQMAWGGASDSEASDSSSGGNKTPIKGSAFQGEILKLGEAPFEFDEANNPSYFITLRLDRGAEKTLWGVDLKRVAHQTPLAVGDDVALEFLGREAVVVKQPVRNDQGRVVNHRTVNSHRNTWKATVLPA
ncbi:MAG: hypothetical protein CMN25_00480 [Salinicola sp.]|uniref:hypothetical protein n=1 Tax=uncultured Salinicola sp. TaxID=1193542 RepID=UPI000C8FCB63|nr:hypothetical protein [uncultured Salinicola sp.]MAM55800.1 hypothetical protein [Salinicola sp.]